MFSALNVGKFLLLILLGNNRPKYLINTVLLYFNFIYAAYEAHVWNPFEIGVI
jgi:hypothetical protein